jgi:hypothetical protein
VEECRFTSAGEANRFRRRVDLDENLVLTSVSVSQGAGIELI